MGTIYTPKTLKHSFADSLYHTPTSQKLRYVIDSLTSGIFTLQWQSKASYDCNDGKKGCCHQIFLFTDMKLFHTLCYPKKQFSVGKSLRLFKCQEVYENKKSMFWNKTW